MNLHEHLIYILSTIYILFCIINVVSIYFYLYLYIISVVSEVHVGLFLNYGVLFFFPAASSALGWSDSQLQRNLVFFTSVFVSGILIGQISITLRLAFCHFKFRVDWGEIEFQKKIFLVLS